ncbi:MAG TPA: hypothetical protein VF649_03905 [Sphingomonas sp.]|jgi:hypothetical protein|uniref:hypothetical protein n=1 Tax=Sphingomonas sp. TaxID=28214 RepID=UPI002ED87CFD
MKRPRNSAWLAGAALLTIVATFAPATGQGSGQGGKGGPESLLPPGFGDAPVAVAPAPAPTPVAPSGEDMPVVPLTLSPRDLNGAPAAEDDAEAHAAAAEETPSEPVYDVPDTARRPVDWVGPLGTGAAGLGAGAFGVADGRFLSAMLRRMDTPIASRWAHMLLRRALLTATPTPTRVDGADWIAERAWLLLRMGEADAARMLVDRVDVDRFTPKLLAVATQAALANADPAALCPLAPIATTMSREPIWPLAQAMCAGLSGEPGVAGALIDQARHGRRARGIDLLLAEKVVGAGSNGRRAVAIEWQDVNRLTAWRFGIASALAVPIPPALYDTAGGHVRAWAARAPMLTPEARVAPARVAAALGVFSSATLVDLYGAVADRTNPDTLDATDAGRLRTAYVGDRAARLAALDLLWGPDPTTQDGYAVDILTARAAAGIVPGEASAARVRRLLSAMFSAGLDLQARRWTAAVTAGSGVDSDAAWAMLAVGDPEPGVDLGSARIAGFVDGGGGGSAQKARLLVAALAGLGRVAAAERDTLAQSAGLNLAAEDRYTRVLDAAAARGETGTVAILAAAGLQTPSWRGVPAAHFYRIIRALDRVGLNGEARMIAAEAMARL